MIGDIVEVTKGIFFKKEIYKGKIVDNKTIEYEDWAGFPSDIANLKVELENGDIINVNETTLYKLKSKKK